MELYGSQSGQNQVDWPQETGMEESMARLNIWEREVCPERPGLPNCAYYMRTGSCGYGAKCRYNHPRDRVTSLVGGEYPERVGEPVCQYYLRTGTCKFGASCKFNHPKNAGGSMTNVPLNTDGYPLRPGEKECSYYLKTGQCKFGVTCRFNHPPPHPSGESMPVSARPFYPTMQTISSPYPEQYGSTSTSSRSARPPILPGSYVAGAYGPMLLHPGVVPIPNWNPYSGSISPAPSPGAESSVRATAAYGISQIGSSAPAFTGAYSQVLSSDGRISKEHQFPERPGQPDCKYYMKTGDCKYGSSCRYNHPVDLVASNFNCALSPLGLPLRQGEPACSFYLQKGQCKFGRTCKFDHPIKFSPPSSYAEMPG